MALAAVAFTSCSDDNDYVPAENVDGVYFTTDCLSIVNVDPEETGFTVQVARTDAGPAATYKMVGTVPEEYAAKFTMPTSVTFAQGEKTANVTVGCNLVPEDLDKKFPLTLTFGDDTPLYPWGFTTYQFSVNVKALDPNKYWKTVGVAYIIDPWICPRWQFSTASGSATLEDLAWGVEAQESMVTPGIYRLVDPWRNEECVVYYLDLNLNDSPETVYVTVDAVNKDCVKIEPQYSGCTVADSQTGGTIDIWIMNLGGYRSAINSLTDEEIIGRGENTLWEVEDNTAFVYIYPGLFGQGEDDLGYAYNSDPEGAIMFEFVDDPAGVIAKKASLVRCIKNGKVDVAKYAKFMSL